MQNPSKARLILIHGAGMDGLSYHLKAEQHIVGRSGQLEFPDDPFVSPTHANLFYRDDELVVRDEGSLNGVFLRVRGSVDIAPGDLFIAGTEVFRLDLEPTVAESADPEGTFFYGSPRQPANFRITQLLEGGSAGMTMCATDTTLAVGREDCDLNFPLDRHLSLLHCTVQSMGGNKFQLVDHSSKNGTYLRIKTETGLTQGDYLYIGRKLLRVELNS
jgi:predicted component of type VI protein secretion system